MCLLIWTVFSGEGYGPWASCFFGFLWIWYLNPNKIRWLKKKLSFLWWLQGRWDENGIWLLPWARGGQQMYRVWWIRWAASALLQINGVHCLQQTTMGSSGKPDVSFIESCSFNIYILSVFIFHHGLRIR